MENNTCCNIKAPMPFSECSNEILPSRDKLTIMLTDEQQEDLQAGKEIEALTNHGWAKVSLLHGKITVKPV